MTVADQIRKLVADGTISKAAGKEFSRHANDLEKLGQIIRQGGNLTEDQRANFRTIYKDFNRYGRENFTDRSPENLRGIFFEGMLGHMIRNEDDANKLRRAITQTTAPAGNLSPAAQQLGMSPDVYNSLNRMDEATARGLGLGDAWKRVRDVETTRTAQAPAPAQPTTRPAAAQQPAPASVPTATPAQATAPQAPIIVAPSAQQEFLSRTFQTKRMSGDDFQRLYGDLNQAGRIHAGDAKDLGRKPLKSMLDVLGHIRDGKPVTLSEMEKLRTFVVREPATAAAQAPAAPGMIGNLGTAARFMGLDRLARAPGAAYGSFTDAWSWGGTSRLLAGTALAAGIGSFVYYNEGDLRGLGPTARTVATFAPSLLDKFIDTSLEEFSGEKKNNTMAAQMFGTLTARDGVLGSRFVEYTKDLTGIDLVEKLKAIPQGDPAYLDVFYDMATKLQVQTANAKDKGMLFGENGKGLNPDALYAYRLAFAANLGLEGGEKAKSFDSIANQLRERIIQTRANALVSGDPEKATVFFKEFLGTTPPTDKDQLHDALLQKYAQMGNAGGQKLAPQVVAQYLVLREVLKPDKKDTTDALTVIQSRVGTKAKTSEAEQERIAQSVNEAARRNDLAIANGTVAAPQQQTGTEISESEYVQRVKDSFGRAATTIPELKDKSSVMFDAFNKARTGTKVDGEKFDKALEQAGVDQMQRQILTVQVKELALHQ